MAEMLKHRGVSKKADLLEITLTCDCMVGEVQVALMAARSSIFDDPEWETMLSSIKPHDLIMNLYWEVIAVFVKWPGLIHDLSMYNANPSTSSTMIEKISQRALAMAKSLNSVGLVLDTIMADDVSIVPTPERSPCAPYSYHFHDRKTLSTFTNYVFLDIIVHCVLLAIQPTISGISSDCSNGWEPGYDFCEDALGMSIFKQQIQLTATRIWMMYDQIQGWKPGGAGFFTSALKISYIGAETVEQQMWVVDALNDLEDFLPEEKKWTPSGAATFCNVATGAISLLDIVKEW